MKKTLYFRSCLFVLCFILSTLSFGQSSIVQTILGTVVDQQSKASIIGATVQLIVNNEKVTGTTTDIDGQFSLRNVPIGRHNLVVSYIGYEELSISNVLVLSGKDVTLPIEIKEAITDLSEVVVRADKNNKAINGMATGSVQTLSMEALMRFSGSFGDPSRMAQNYAGVSSATDDRNDIIVRGNSPSGVLWRLEGVNIPSPNHWSTLGTTGGPISILNANNLADADFFSGAFPAEYGNASAAVFDMKLRNGNTEKHEFLGQIGFNGFEFGAEGPLSFGKNASFIANARYSTLGVFKVLGINFGTGSATPDYKDAVFKLNMPTQNSGTFSLWGLGGISNISFYDSGDNIYSQGSGRIESGSTTGVLGLSHLYFLNNTTTSKITLSIAYSKSDNSAAEIVNDDEPFQTNYTAKNQQIKYAINAVVNKKFSAKDRLKLGVTTDIYDLRMNDATLVADDLWENEIDFTGTTALVQSFAQWQHYFNQKLNINVGLHHSSFILNNTTILEPRFGLNYQLTSKHSLSLAIGQHSQTQALPIYFHQNNIGELPNKQLDFMRSTHFVLGWDYQVAKNLKLKTEIYHQRLSKIAVEETSSSFSIINYGADFVFPNRLGLVNNGTGDNSGIELTIEKKMTKGFYALATVSVFDSKYKGSDGIERNTFFNANFASNLLLGKEFNFSSRWILALDGKVTYAKGRRYTPIDLSQSKQEDRRVLDQTQIYGAQYQPYFSTNFKISVRNNAKKYAQVWAIDLVNLTNHKNEFSKSYNRSTQNISTTYQRGLFVNVLYQILF